MPGISGEKEKVCIIGSGNWGSAISKIIGKNVLAHPEFSSTVKMWVFEEYINGRKLTEIINTCHDNVKYLPNIKLPPNVVACSDIVECVEDATILVFVIPHQFVKSTCEKIRGKLREDCRAISLIKGIDISKGGLLLISEEIRKSLSIDVSVLMGANVAREVALEQFCETTIGYNDPINGEIFKKLFNTNYFRVNAVQDVSGVELCGALKNVVALAAGFVDGLKMGSNTKAAIIRIGIAEMKKFSHMFYIGIKNETFFESCGVADVVTTCYGGRHRKLAEAHVLTGKAFDDLEKEMLNGQKLQGTITSKEIYQILTQHGCTEEFPLFTTVYRICYENLCPSHIIHDI